MQFVKYRSHQTPNVVITKKQQWQQKCKKWKWRARWRSQGRKRSNMHHRRRWPKQLRKFFSETERGRQCRPTSSTLSVGRQCLPASSTISVGRQCRPASSTLSVGRQCRPASSTLSVGRHCRPTSSTLSVGQKRRYLLRQKRQIEDEIQLINRQITIVGISFLVYIINAAISPYSLGSTLCIYLL